MAVIAPLRGLRPDPQRVDLAKATWAMGTIPAGTGVDAMAMREKVAKGELVRDRTPAFYRYEVSFGPADERKHATGFFARILLDSLAEAAEAAGPQSTGNASAGHPGPDVEPVVLRYGDERGWVDEVLSSNAFDEVARFTDEDGAEHRLWRVERGEGVAEVTAQFEDRVLRLEAGGRLLQVALARWRETGSDADSAILCILAPEGGAPAPWRAGLVLSPRDESRPRPWQELAGDPGKPQWRTPPLG